MYRRAAHTERSLYGAAIKKWTRSQKVYNEFDTIILLDAFYNTWDVRDALIKEFSEKNTLSQQEKDEFIAREKSEHSKIYRFIFAVYTGDNLWNDLEKENSIWQIILQDKQGNKLEPERITVLKKRDIQLQKFYPFITPWKKIYKVDFPKQELDDKGAVRLIISSMLGKVELNFNY